MMQSNGFTKDVFQVRQAFNSAANKYDASALLQRTVCDRLMESFDHIKLKPKTVLDLGSGTGYGARQIVRKFKKTNLFQLDIAEQMLKRSLACSRFSFSKPKMVCADAAQMPLPDNSVDLVFSNLMMQWCDDLDAVFSEVRRILKPKGVFLFSSFGPDSLKELRQSWQQVDQEVHVNAFVDMHDIGDALIRNGLDAPVLNVEHIVLTYRECKQLMRELKDIGAHNINRGRRKTLTGKQRLNSMIQHYETLRKDGVLPVTYEVIYGHAWCPSRETAAMQGEDLQAISLEQLKNELKNHGTDSV